MINQQLAKLTKLLRELLDLIAEDPDFEVIERYPYSPDGDEPSKGGAA
jgi:hypothetical protein